MALSAQLFYTQKIYPCDIITNKNTIPEDPNERLKDKVFMSVVFTVKHFCDYKKYVVPETTFKDDLKCTEDQLKKILESLSKKYNVSFQQKKFKDIRELTIYVKDHQTKSSNELLFEIAIGIPVAAAIIATVGIALQRLFKGDTPYVDIYDWDAFKKEYAKLCDIILKQAKDDPFFSKEQHSIYTVDEGIVIYKMIIKRFETFLKLPHKKDEESKKEYQERLVATMRSLKYDDYGTFLNSFPKRKPHTYIEAQLFDIAKVDKCIKMFYTILGMYSKMEEHEKSVCKDDEANRVWFDLGLGGEQEITESFYEDTFGCDFQEHAARILKYMKERLEQAKKQQDK